MSFKKRAPYILFLVLVIAIGAGCGKNKNVSNPIANVDSKQPDKVLFDRALEAMKRNKFDVARITLQTLINTYPDSEFIARAKLAVGDSWYAEGGSAALQQAEIEYKDFITFFPEMQEASEAQLKVAGIHYKQMEKPDRDYTHAKRAEQEYKSLIEQFPDSPLIPEAKLRLLEVQEVLAEREFRIGRFYYLRESWPAAIARLRSMVDTYPLYSSADEALYLLGDIYERQIEIVRQANMGEAQKGRAIQELTRKAQDSYARIITRYPVQAFAEQARERLQDLNRPVPEPTQEAIAQNKAEVDSRGELSRTGRMMMMFKKRPDVASATKVGEPTLAPPPETNATDVAKENLRILMGAGDANTVKAQQAGTDVKLGSPSDVPRRQQEAAQDNAAQDATAPDTTAQDAADQGTTEAQPPVTKPNESTSKKKKKSGVRKFMPF